MSLRKIRVNSSTNFNRPENFFGLTKKRPWLVRFFEQILSNFFSVLVFLSWFSKTNIISNHFSVSGFTLIFWWHSSTNFKSPQNFFGLAKKRPWLVIFLSKFWPNFSQFWFFPGNFFEKVFLWVENIIKFTFLVKISIEEVLTCAW